jgi:hypothetical protein
MYRRTSVCLLLERILHTRREVHAVYKELLELHLHLVRDLIERLTTEKASRVADRGKARHCRKFELLHDSRPTTKMLIKPALAQSCSAPDSYWLSREARLEGERE